MKTRIAVLAVVFVVAVCGKVFGAHPLETDDTGTQGKGKFQLELTGEYGYDKETEAGVTVKRKDIEIADTLSYGLSETLDAVLGLPYCWWKEESAGVSNSEGGISDTSFELKWRFFEKEKLSFAIKPGISIPTGDEDKGLGTGKVGYSLFFIITGGLEPCTLHLNCGYIRNENKFSEREDIWTLSLAAEFGIGENSKVVADIGVERNPNPASDTAPAFGIIGFIHSLSGNFDVDFGFKFGLNRIETDYAILIGITLRF
jgi:hypothetical protein